MTDLSQLSDEEVNEALAILIGWVFRPCNGKGKSACRGWLVSPDFRQSVTLWKDGSTGGDSLPPYCSSLDECAKVEAGLTREQKELFAGKLYWLLIPREDQHDDHFLSWDIVARLLTATARQRAEALIATLQP